MTLSGGGNCSERALDFLAWMHDVSIDPERAAVLMTGTTMAAQAVVDGAARSTGEAGALANELRRAGYITWQIARHDQ